MPPVTVSVTVSLPPRMSTSEIEIALPLAALKTRSVFWVANCVPFGAVLTGALFTAVTLTVWVTLLKRSAPTPLPPSWGT